MNFPYYHLMVELIQSKLTHKMGQYHHQQQQQKQKQQKQQLWQFMLWPWLILPTHLCFPHYNLPLGGPLWKWKTEWKSSLLQALTLCHPAHKFVQAAEAQPKTSSTIITIVNFCWKGKDQTTVIVCMLVFRCGPCFLFKTSIWGFWLFLFL